MNSYLPSTDFLSFDKNLIISNLDKTKETIVSFTNNFNSLNYDHVNGFIKSTLDILKIKYNIIYIGYESNSEYDINSLISINSNKLKNFIKLYMKNKKEYNKESDEYNFVNHGILYNYIHEKLSWITNIKYITGITTVAEWRLMFQKHTVAGPKYRNMYNEFHDYIGNDPNELNEVRNIISNTVENYVNYINPLAFLQSSASVFYNILLVLFENNKNTIKSIDGFANDPTFFFPLFESLTEKNRIFYFANDKRGTRPYCYFPISELQHIVYDNEFLKKQQLYDDIFNNEVQVKKNEEKNLFVFMGTILNIKGNRSTLWEQYLKNLNLENSAFYIPPVKQGIIFKPTTEKRIVKRQENFTVKLKNLLEEIVTHPLYKGYLLPNQVNSIIDKYKYTFIMRCVSCNDSLNYRPVQYTYHRILFFLDPMYDPEYLQIPKHIQDKLIVHNSADIENKIKYFEEHENEREQILDELWKHFNIDKWLESEYSKNIVLSYYP